MDGFNGKIEDAKANNGIKYNETNNGMRAGKMITESRSVISIIDMFKEGFTLSIEIFPPKNYEDKKDILKVIDEIAKERKIDFMSITKGRKNNSRAGSSSLAGIAKSKGIEVLSHLTCAGYSKEEIENFIVEVNYFGVKNILAIRGDYSECGDSIDFIKQLDGIRKGNFYGGKGKGIDICIGVAAHIEDKDYEKEMEYLKRKEEAGADFAITQLFFYSRDYDEYVKRAREKGISIPILPGIMPVLNDKTAEFVEKNIGIKVPENTDVDFYVKLIEELRNLGAPGVHLFILNNVDVLKEIIQKIYM